jgi:hypothetical protein
MEKLGGIEECPTDYNHIKIKFVNPSQIDGKKNPDGICTFGISGNIL